MGCRPDGVSWSAFAVIVAGLVGTFVWADTSVLVPEFGGMFTPVCVALLGTVLACMPLVVAVQLRRRPRNSAAVWWAGVSAALVPAFLPRPAAPAPHRLLDARGCGMTPRCRAAGRIVGRPVPVRRHAVTHAAVVRNTLGLRPLWRLKAVLKPKASA